MMLRRIGFLAVSVLALGGWPASAQPRAEVSVNVGYSASEGIESEDRLLLGQIYNGLDMESGGSFNFTIGFFVGENAELEFLYGRQSSRLLATGPGADLDISDMTITNYMFNYVYNFGAGDSRTRPYVFGGLGATTNSFGDLLLTLPPGLSGEIDSKTRFSTNWGGGVKFYFNETVGAKAGVRWTPTFIRSEPEGLWCDPFYGCWQIANLEYANQFEMAAGITLRFD
jgi:opacity protein-like surface antigen